MKNTSLFVQAMRNGERFLTKNNFLLAKQAFEAALILQETPDLLEKLALCVQGIARQERKKRIKQGRRLEQKGQWAEALFCFEQVVAAATEEEEGGDEGWVRLRITELQKKIKLSEMMSMLSRVEQGDDLGAKVEAYTQILALHNTVDDFSQEILAKRMYCLLQQGCYAEVTELYDAHPPTSCRCRYYAGFAYAKVGQYPMALLQWVEVKCKDPQFVQQRLTLIPFVYRALRTIPVEQAHVSAYRNICRLLEDAPRPEDWRPYADALLRLVLTFFWQKKRFAELLDLLSPLAQNLSVSLLGLYARVYIKLAEEDLHALEKAIPLWLTALHTEPLLDRLYARQQNPDMVLSELRDRLWQSLERMITQGAMLPSGLLAFWQTENRIIQRLAALPRLKGAPDIFPCTPEFAILYGQSAKVLAFLQENQAVLGGGDAAFQELCAYFSPWGPCLIQVVRGEEEAALARMTAVGRGALADYCRQKIHWHCGIKKLLRGERQARKHLVAALPLIKSYPFYVDELVRMAFSDLEMVAYVELAEILELLHTQISTEPFQEATAHVMGLKATHLLNTSRNSATALKILDKAEAIHPGSVMVQTVRVQAQRRLTFDRLSVALRKNSLDRAVQILQDDTDPEPREYFFETMERWTLDILAWKEGDREKALARIYDHCFRLEPDHPVVRIVAQRFQGLEVL